MNPDELDFIAWMDDVDLEEVNLLDQPPESRDGFEAGAPEVVNDDGSNERPRQGNVGWDAE